MTKVLKFDELNEYKNNQIKDDLIVEMARINGNELPYLVYVYGGNSYGAGRKEHGEPHFHFMDKINDGKFKLSILIPNQKELDLINDLIIIEEDSSQINWNGLKKEKQTLLEWLNKMNIDVPTITNLKMIITQWNILNRENKNVKQIK